jgi:hypothetical protein
MMNSVRGDRTSILIRNLTPGQNHHFKLQARNSKGYGPFSPSVSLLLPQTRTPSQSNDVRDKIDDMTQISNNDVHLLVSRLIRSILFPKFYCKVYFKNLL